MTKHTPGPWRASDTESGYNKGDIYIYTPRGLRVAGIFGPDAYRRQHRANARLIAAAPDLLEACAQALVHIEGDEATHGRNFAAGNVLRAAIAKAKGDRP